MGKALSHIHHSRSLYDPPPRILEIKAKINKWDLIKIKSFRVRSCIRLPVVAMYLSAGKVKAVSRRQTPHGIFSFRVGHLV